MSLHANRHGKICGDGVDRLPRGIKLSKAPHRRISYSTVMPAGRIFTDTALPSMRIDLWCRPRDGPAEAMRRSAAGETMAAAPTHSGTHY